MQLLCVAVSLLFSFNDAYVIKNSNRAAAVIAIATHSSTSLNMAGFGKVEKKSTVASSLVPSDNKQTCSCGSGAAYDSCCKKFHDSLTAGSPEQVVRGRFSALVYNYVPFLIATTHPDNKDFCGEDTAEQMMSSKRSKRDIWAKDLKKFCEDYEFKELAFGEQVVNEADAELSLTLNRRKKGEMSWDTIDEKSRFKKDAKGAWAYIGSSMVIKPAADGPKKPARMMSTMKKGVPTTN